VRRPLQALLEGLGRALFEGVDGVGARGLRQRLLELLLRGHSMGQRLLHLLLMLLLLLLRVM
jgi:hypothetical protein